MLDIESLLQPISAARPGGEDLSFTPEFDAIQEARRSDDASLDQGEWVTELKAADWPTVARLCGELLATRSKDLRLAAWLAEAMTRTDGFAGAAASYRLAAGLCNRFWSQLHPADEAGETDLRSGALAWLLTHSIRWIRTVALTDAPQGRFNALDVEAAPRHAVDDGGSTPDSARVEAAGAATPTAFHERTAAALSDARQALRELEAAVAARLGDSGPSFTATREALNAAAAIAARMTHAAADATDDETMAAAPMDPPGPAAPAGRYGGDRIATREDALRRLQQVAEFFRRTEPHSPVAYLAERAARWGRMPLHVWLQTVLKDNPALPQLEELLGLPAGTQGREDPRAG